MIAFPSVGTVSATTSLLVGACASASRTEFEHSQTFLTYLLVAAAFNRFYSIADTNLCLNAILANVLSLYFIYSVHVYVVDAVSVLPPPPPSDARPASTTKRSFKRIFYDLLGEVSNYRAISFSLIFAVDLMGPVPVWFHVFALSDAFSFDPASTGKRGAIVVAASSACFLAASLGMQLDSVINGGVHAGGTSAYKIAQTVFMFALGVPTAGRWAAEISKS